MITDTQANFTVIRWPSLEDKPEVPVAYLVWCIYTTPVYSEVVYCTLDLQKAQIEQDRLQELYATFCTNYCIEEIELS